jgi:glycosyltransferase involved in cell wall biosynthesis
MGMEIIYFIDNKLGGITSFNYNIINNPQADDTKQWVINIDQKEWAYTRSNMRFPSDKEFFFNFSIKDNLYTVISRLHKLVPHGPGAIILNDCLEMQMLDHYPVEQTSYQVVHDDYNFSLAERYEHIVDVFIAHSRFFYDKLLTSLPHRAEAIFFLPHGVSIPASFRKQSSLEQPLKLLFLGRMTKTKGIFDLPEIDNYLNKWKVPHTWTCIGNGPELKKLKDTWHSASSPVLFLSPSTNEEVMAVCASQDVFVLPTQFEGSPVSLLETMSAGLVPVITDLPGGIREIVLPGIGYRVKMGDIIGFANYIAELATNRSLLNQQSVACRQKIINEFNVKNTAARYHELFARHKEFYRSKKIQRIKIGSRLDQSWVPSFLTNTIRKFNVTCQFHW